MELIKAIADIEKRFGKGSIMKLGDRPHGDIDVISTGCLSLDNALGVGGLPRGRVIEIFGPESSGKSTLALQVVAQAQKLGGIAAYVDSEFALDTDYAAALGVDISELLISQPDCAEDCMEIVESLVTSNEVTVVVVDSVAAMVPQAEINNEMGDSTVGVMARLMSQAMRKLTGPVSKSNTCLIFINQLRSKIGVTWGSPETTTGGNALKFYSSVRIDIRRIGAIKDGEKIVGNRTKIKTVKNKVAPPFKEVEVDVIYGEGISKVNDLLDLAIANGVVKQAGAWFSYGDEKPVQGKEKVKERLKSDELFFIEVKAKVQDLLK